MFFSDNINLKFAENSEIQGIIDFYKSGCYYQIVDKCLRHGDWTMVLIKEGKYEKIFSDAAYDSNDIISGCLQRIGFS